MRGRRSGHARGWYPEVRGLASRTFGAHTVRWWVATVAIVGCLVIGMALFIGAVVLFG